VNEVNMAISAQASLGQYIIYTPPSSVTLRINGLGEYQIAHVLWLFLASLYEKSLSGGRPAVRRSGGGGE